MNTKELECFLAVCEEKSIHKAADRMFISVQGMSRIIKKLESEIGAEILHRTPQGVRLTGEGEILARHAGSIIDNISNMNREIRKSVDGVSGNLSVGISYGLLGFYRHRDAAFVFLFLICNNSPRRKQRPRVFNVPVSLTRRKQRPRVFHTGFDNPL